MKHGLSRTGTGRSWRAMLTRCYNKKSPAYLKYGGAGIVVCEFLRASPLNLGALIGERPLGKTIDRTDNRGVYSCGQCAECFSNNWPLNVRWATRLEQNRNQNDLKYLTINGETKCLAEWSSISGVSRGGIYMRIRLGWPTEALLLPPHKPKTVTIRGETKTVQQWADLIGIDQSSFRARVEDEWPEELLLTPPSN